MWPKAASATVLLLVIAACSTVPPAPSPMDELWRDQAFGYSPSLVSVSEVSLFELDAGLARSLRDNPAAVRGNQATRTALLLSLIFGPDMKTFAYAGGHSTLAAETWRNQRGDCLSLSVMSVALARALDVPVQIQEVRVPVAFDRRGGVDFLNNHVNVLVPNERDLRVMNRTLPPGYIVVDFEPQVGARRKGQPLADRAVLARFYNNLAAEQLAQGQNRLAYAHFKAAILADPSYAASYGNIAQLYLRVGFNQEAERLLRHAVALTDQSDLALTTLHQLLLSQGRDIEAAQFARELEARREHDPYYWLGLGLEKLQQARFPQAIAALERAQALTTGFEEVHRYLAIAYWRAGKPLLARDQLAVLSAIDRGDASVALLNKKFERRPEQGPLQQ
jgi:tetratricopeptide (TPR) repeat protein